MGQQTATEMMARDKERRKYIFEQMMDDFIHNYAPDDPRQSSRFAAELISLVRQVHTDAQAPLLEMWSKTALAFPNPILGGGK